MTQEELMNQLNTIGKRFSDRLRRDWAIENLIYERMRAYEIPFLLIKEDRHGRIHATPMVSSIVDYRPAGAWGRPGDKAGIIYGSTIYHLDTGKLRIAPKELQDQLISIADQIYELNKKKTELLKEWWPKSKKLSWQKAEDYAAIKKQYWPPETKQ